MRARRASPQTPAITAALAELRQLILHKYPDARFDVRRGVDDPDSFELTATVDVEDGFDVLDLVMDRVLDFQQKNGLPIHVIPVQPLDRDRALREAAAVER